MLKLFFLNIDNDRKKLLDLISKYNINPYYCLGQELLIYMINKENISTVIN